MKFIKRFFKSNKKTNDNWIMFSTPESELKEFLISMGKLTIGDNYLRIDKYPFEPSIAFNQVTFEADQIDDIDYKSYPPAFRIEKELIFLSNDKKVELEEFAKNNNIKSVERPPIWSWILEPFLDTEYTAETDQRLTKLLDKYGLNEDQVNFLRAEVETQMLKYNFDTMLWEWCVFDASDVLRAMRTKYTKEEFEEFYKRVMEIAFR